MFFNVFEPPGHPILELRWAILGLCWAILGPSWSYAGPSWLQVGVLGPILAPSSRSWRPSWLQVGGLGDHLGSKLGVLGAILKVLTTTGSSRVITRTPQRAPEATSTSKVCTALRREHHFYKECARRLNESTTLAARVAPGGRICDAGYQTG